MTATILDGRALAKTLREELRAEIQAFVADAGVAPALAVVQVAGDSASDRYVRSIQKACGDTEIVAISSRSDRPDMREGTDVGVLIRPEDCVVLKA